MSVVKLTILLSRDLDTGTWYVLRLEAERDVVRTQTRFRSPIPLRSAFCPEFAEFLMEVMPAHTDSSVFSVQEKSLPTLGVFFSGLRVVAQRALAGLQSVTVRSRQAEGPINRIYADELLAAHPNATNAPAFSLEKH